MLSAYFDDSGTHGNADFVVWAGVAGRDEDFDKLDATWSAKLERPLLGKPPLRKFSLRDCAHADGEFKDYRPPERDALRYDMRSIIKESGVRPRAYVVPVALYNRIIRGRVRRAYGPPDGVAFASCADWALRIADINEMSLSCVFDKGQQRPWLDFLLNEADERAADRGVKITYGYGAVADHCGLQAADTIATEHLWYSLECMQANPPKITPHFASLIQMTDPSAYVLLEKDLLELRDEFRRLFPLRDWLFHKNKPVRKLPWPSSG